MFQKSLIETLFSREGVFNECPLWIILYRACVILWCNHNVINNYITILP